MRARVASCMALLVDLVSGVLVSSKIVPDGLVGGGVLDPYLFVQGEMDLMEVVQQDQLAQQMEDGEVKLAADLERAEQFQAMAPNQPGQSGENTPATGASSKNKSPSQPERDLKAAQEAK